MKWSSFKCTQGTYVRNSLPLNTHKVPKISCSKSSFERRFAIFYASPCLLYKSYCVEKFQNFESVISTTHLLQYFNYNRTAISWGNCNSCYRVRIRSGVFNKRGPIALPRNYYYIFKVHIDRQSVVIVYLWNQNINERYVTRCLTILFYVAIRENSAADYQHWRIAKLPCLIMLHIKRRYCIN